MLKNLVIKQNNLLNNIGKYCFSVDKTALKPKLPDFDYTPPKYEGPSKEELLKLRKDYLNPAIFHYYQDPLIAVEGKMQYIFDETGRRYLDFFGGIVTVSVGHSHPKVVKAGQEQLGKIMHTTTIYHNTQTAPYAKELADSLPEGLDNIYFTNSGSEANDLALLMARCHTGNYDIVALRNCYHGMSYNTMNITSLHTWKYPVPNTGGILHALTPDTYRGPFGDEPGVGEKYANDVKNLIQHCSPGKVAGFICESMQGVGGSVELPEGYLQKAYEHVRNAGGLCIADEVQTGFGRLGTHFWGFQTHGVTPDIVVMAKSIGNGAPLAAVATTKEVAQTLAQRIHFNTYGGNPVSCAIGRATLQAMKDENTQQNCLEMGNLLLDGFGYLQEKYDTIGDVRGKGLMLGMEIVKNKDTKEPNPELVGKIFERTRDHGLLIGKGGLYGNVFRIKPPMCINKHDVNFAIEVLDNCFAELS